ncbi:hypothetical protein [Amycolatopsis sp. NPDC050768]|uniref:hypothetical protein n=1 Tax=Amycolatopsis sp. NPDC050768 TaxID=3154839 RepID=UPI0033DA29B7
MAKNSFPGLKTGSSPLAKLISTVVVLALLVLVVKYPSDAASAVHGAASVGSDAIDGVVSFFRGLQGH